LKEAQAQLIQTEKLASLGKLSASIAHEINNPLSGILTYAKLLSRKLRVGAPDAAGVQAALQQLALVERETQRCCSIVRNLLDFARQREPSFQPVDVGSVIDEALSLLSNRLSIQNVEVTRELAPVPTIQADFGQVRQAFVNIVMNACEAMPKGGNLRVVTREVNLPGDGRTGPLSPTGKSGRPTRFAEVVVTDTGQGIPPEHLSKRVSDCPWSMGSWRSMAERSWWTAGWVRARRSPCVSRRRPPARRDAAWLGRERSSCSGWARGR
jgi:two-component system NtrC family sensor kinase